MLSIFVIRHSQRKDLSPSKLEDKIKFVKGAHCVNHYLSTPIVTNVPHVVRNPPVGGRLQKFWQVWLSLGSNPRVVSILWGGYSLPFKVRPPSNQVTLGSQWVCKPNQNHHLKDSLQVLFQKQAVENVVFPSSLVFYNRWF